MKKQIKTILFFALFLVFGLFASRTITVSAAEESTKAISIGKIDYDVLTMDVYPNGNSITYYSTDKKTWYEVEGVKTADNAAYVMDISWVSSKVDTTLYFKGDVVTTVISVTLPKTDTSFKVIYDKADILFDFENCDDATSFQWKKDTDYNWNTVSLENSSASYQNFMNKIETFLVKGIKLTFRIAQVPGTSDSEPGERPSKEVTVSLTKRANAPNIIVNSSKLTLNTTENYEYYNEKKKTWIECDKSMTLEDIAPETLYKNGGKTTTLMIRIAATSTKTYSKTAYVTIPGQTAPPSIGSSKEDVSYYYMNGKLCLQFNNASKTDVYSYAIVKPGSELDIATAKFTTVTNTMQRTLSQSTAPEGSIIYVRKHGTNANTSKNVSLVLSSEVAKITVSYQ